MKRTNLLHGTNGLLSAALLLGIAGSTAGCDPDGSTDLDMPSSAGAEDVERVLLDFHGAFEGQDAEGMRALLTDDAVIDVGPVRLEGADAVVGLAVQTIHAEIELLESSFHERGGTLVYHAVDGATGNLLRVSSKYTVEANDGDEPRIRSLTVVASATEPPMQTVERPFSELQFFPAAEDPSVPVELAPLWGNPEVGRSGSLLRIGGGFPGFPHIHSAGYRAVMIEGIVRNGPDPLEAPEIGPGGYFSQQSDAVHTTVCTSDEDCLMYIEFDGPIDALPQ